MPGPANGPHLWIASPPAASTSAPVPVSALQICLGPHLSAVCCRMSRDLDADIYGPHIPWREYSFMSNPRLPQAVLDSVVMLEVCKVGALAQGFILDCAGQCDRAGLCALAHLLVSVHCISAHLN